MEALRVAATGAGSLCIVNGELPPDIDEVLAAIAEPSTGVHLFVCEKKPKKTAEELIAIPQIASRAAEVDLVVQEYGAESMAALRMEGLMKVEDRVWVIKNCSESVAELEKGALRIEALRKHKTKTGAATDLGMSRVALGKWLYKRSDLPFKLKQE